MNRAQKIVDHLLENYRWDDRPPARQTYGHDADTDLAAKSPFTAWNLALERGVHDPRLWAVIKGSPFENQYRQKFNPAD